MSTAIVIPTYNRRHLIKRALDSSLHQLADDTVVVVVDDGSTDGTYEFLRTEYSQHPVALVRLTQNVGTAQAKNVGLALCSGYDSICFHDSDDLYHPHKILLQRRSMLYQDARLLPFVDYPATEFELKENFDVVTCQTELITGDGQTEIIGKDRIVLVEDIFPTLLEPVHNQVGWDWILINPALFSLRVFRQLGGFMDCIEEDRELRNRTILAGMRYFHLNQPLITKLVEPDSLTEDEATNLASSMRQQDRQRTQARTKKMLKHLYAPSFTKKFAVPIDLEPKLIESVHGGELLKPDFSLPSTQTTTSLLKSVIKTYSLH